MLLHWLGSNVTKKDRTTAMIIETEILQHGIIKFSLLLLEMFSFHLMKVQEIRARFASSFVTKNYEFW